MATHEVLITPIEIEEHPNADALQVGKVGDYRCIVQKGLYKSGDYVAYIPEDSVLPEWLIQRMELEGKLAGSKKNRVKPIRLRGIFSQGLCYPINVESGNLILETENDTISVKEGEDVSDVLEVTKYEAPIPTQMAGEVDSGIKYTYKFDVENIKKYPEVFTSDDDVVITEKLHGTFTGFGYHPDLGTQSPIIFSKGLGAKGLRFKLNEVNESNLYIRCFNSLENEWGNLVDRIAQFLGVDKPVHVFGETFGKGVQDLSYGLEGFSFRAFMILIDYKPVSFDTFKRACSVLGIKSVPILYEGKFDPDIVRQLTDGKETISKTHIREGIVIALRSMEDREDLKLPILKSVSEKYLLRKNGTEYN